ncbi:MAG: hypothetical protein ACYTAF_06280, partial [Planctomycetota bacterium]
MSEFILDHLLTLIIFAPMAGVVVLLFLPKESQGAMKGVSVAATLIPLILCMPLVTGFDEAGGIDPNRPGAGLTLEEGGQFQFVEDYEWIKPFNIHYIVAVDGLSITMVVLTCLLSFLCIFASFGIDHWKINRGVKGYFALFLMLQAG